MMGNGRIRKRPNRFTQVSNAILGDKVTLKAVGLYTKINYYLNIPNFDLYKAYLQKQCLEGKSAFNSAWNELKEKGYLIVERKRDDNGQFVYEYELLDEPCTDFQHTEKPTTEEPIDDKPIDINKTLGNNTLNNNTNIIKDGDDEFIVDRTLFMYNAKLGASVTHKYIKSLLNDHSEKKILELLKSWDSVTEHIDVNNVVGYFQTLLENGWKVNSKAGKSRVEQVNNFNQREYDGDYTEFYS